MAFNKLMPLALWLLSLGIAGALTDDNQESEKQCQSELWRLPRRVLPVHYELELNIDSNKLEYGGIVEIDLAFNKTALERDLTCQGAEASKLFACQTSTIILHAGEEVNIQKVEFVEGKSGQAIEVEETCRDYESSQLVVSLSREPDLSSPGKLTIWFDGTVATEIGLFQSGYLDANNEDHPIVVTDFEPGFARTAFPLFDEPDLKATFGLTIKHAPGLKAVSNMPPVKEDLENDLITVQFERTPRMSSYLLAFAVGKFDHIETTILDGNMTIGIFTAPGRAEEGRLGLERAARAYQALLDFFKIEMPIKKIDFLTVDAMNGAMENWGLITFETGQILNGDRERSVPRDEHFASSTITHELAHQWFGNLVTMKWWDDLWLNEGFADWIAGELCSELYPELDCELNFLLDTMTTALVKDGDESATHPIKNLKLQTNKEVDDSFDEITYKKAHCVIRMLKDFVGTDQFKQGLRLYMLEHTYGNTEAEDLWAALKKASGLEVESMIETWIYQAGFPLVEAKLSPAGDSLELSQNKFPGVSEGSRPGLIKWKIPVSVLVSDGNKLTKLKTLMDDFEHKLKLPVWFNASEPGHWLKLNANFEGFYRVHYADEKLVAALGEAVRAEAMAAADRVNLIDDIRELYKASLISKEELLHRFSWFDGDENDAVIIKLEQLIRLVISDLVETNEPQLTNTLSILKSYYTNTGSAMPVEGESVLRSKARVAVITLLIRVRDPIIIEEALALYQSTKGQVAASLQQAIYTAVAVAGDEEQFLDLLDRIDKLDKVWYRARDEFVYLLKVVLAGSDRLSVVEEYFDK